MAFWTFRAYITEDRKCPIIDWYGTLGPAIQADFDVFIKELSDTEDWDEVKQSRRKFKEMQRKHLGLCELIFDVSNGRRRHFRPIGIRFPEILTFLLLSGCEKGERGKTVPEGVFDDALRLKAAYEAGRGETRDYV